MLKSRFSFRGATYFVEDMPRVDQPCHVVVGESECGEPTKFLPTRHGFSGAPWCWARADGQCQLVGMHVAKVVLISENERYEASLVVPSRRLFMTL